MYQNYMYPAIVDWDNKDKAYIIEFIDIEAFTFADADKEILKMANEVLSLHIYDRLINNEKIPKPTKLKDIKLKDKEYTILVEVGEEDFIEIKSL